MFACYMNCFPLSAVMVLYRHHHYESVCSCWNSIYNLPVGLGKDISDHITAMVEPRLQEVLKDCKLPEAVFIVKNPGQGHENLLQSPSPTAPYGYSSPEGQRHLARWIILNRHFMRSLSEN